MDGFILKSQSEISVDAHTCGTCMYHVLNKNQYQPGTIRKGKGKGQLAYWVCGCEDCDEYHKGKVCEDGRSCSCYETRTFSRMGEWVDNVHKEANERAKARREASRLRNRHSVPGRPRKFKSVKI